MNVEILSKKLEEDPEKIIKVLDALGYENAHFNPQLNTLRFAREIGANPTGCVLNCSNLTYIMFSVNRKGNLYSLIMDQQNCSFPEALHFAATVAGFDESELNIRIHYPFGGFYKSLIANEEDEIPLQTYPEEALIPYAGKFNMRFFRDGIDFDTQAKYGIGYDLDSGRITIPERSITGELVGIMGRANDDDCPHENRWLPIIPTSRSKTLYGYVNNYKHIVENGLVTIWESEKAVCQCDSFGEYTALATCGCHISDTQIRYIKMLHPQTAIIAYDEGLDEEQIEAEARKLLSTNHILNIHVGYIWDNASIIPTGSKQNLADLGHEAYTEGLQKYVKWL